MTTDETIQAIRFPFSITRLRQQQGVEEFPWHPQVGPLPASRPASTPPAQPTPARTRIASRSQFLAQAPHSMQAPRSARTARLSSSRNTACGQTRVHIPQPLHRLASNSSVTTFSRYLIPQNLPQRTGRSAKVRTQPRFPRSAPARQSASRATRRLATYRSKRP